jgi:hypothetical protein
MLEYWKRISCGRCLTKALEGAQSSKATEDKLATDLFLMYNNPEIRIKSIDKKIDEISTMLDDNIPIIEEL